MVEVVGALIWKNDTFLILRRPPEKGCALLWEFVGGKVEAGEDPRAALARECREELDCEVDVGEPFCDVVHEYPDATVHLTVYFASVVGGDLKLLEHVGIDYITAEQIPGYDFCPADRDILVKIREYSDARKASRQPIVPGRYRHYKGNLYEVVGTAHHSETLEDMVVYRALYGKGELWVRPAAMWNELITKDGKTFPRFAKIED